MYQRSQRRCTAMIFAFKIFLFRDVAVVVAVLVFLNSLSLLSSAPFSPGRRSLATRKIFSLALGGRRLVKGGLFDF